MPSDERFTLQNDPPKWKQDIGEPDKRQQKTMFGGLDCLPGQIDLFSTDGTGTSGVVRDEDLGRPPTK